MGLKITAEKASGIIISILERIEECKKRYSNAVKGLDINGQPLKSDGGFIRTRELRELQTLCLVRDLFKAVSRIGDDVALSDPAYKGLEKLVYPVRRHTRIKGDERYDAPRAR